VKRTAVGEVDRARAGGSRDQYWAKHFLAPRQQRVEAAVEMGVEVEGERRRCSRSRSSSRPSSASACGAAARRPQLRAAWEGRVPGPRSLLEQAARSFD
jgi:hypothetical protein